MVKKIPESNGLEIFLQASLHQISDLLTLVSSLYWIQRKSYGDFGSLARLAFGSDLGMMKGCAVFYDRQSQSCTAGLPGMTFIYTIKGVRKLAPVLLWQFLFRCPPPASIFYL